MKSGGTPESGTRPGHFLQLAVVLTIGCLIWSASFVRAADRTSLFESANKLYYSSKFSEAATAYQKLLESGERSAAVYFNLGNAYFKAGEIGKAVNAYRQAEELAPRDPDIRANLQFARNQARGPKMTHKAWEQWLNRLTLNEWTGYTMAAIWLCLCGLISIQVRPRLRDSLKGIIWALLLVSLALVGCTFAAYQAHHTVISVVTTKEATAHQGPIEESQEAFRLHDGAEVRVLEKKDDWLLVSTDPGHVGWVRRQQLAEKS